MNGRWYDVSVLPQFIEDMNGIKDYITYDLHNPLAADNLERAVKKAIEGRRYFPEAYEKLPSRRKRKRPYYRIRVKNYTILYMVKGTTIEVRRIFHSSRDIQNYI